MRSVGRLLRIALVLALSCPAASVAEEPSDAPPPFDEPEQALDESEPGLFFGWSETRESSPRVGPHRPATALLAQCLSTPQGRHRGLGCPLVGESWLNRPYSAGWFMGAMTGSPLIDDWIGLKTGFSGGYRIGWDSDYYWGLETRLTLAGVPVCDSARAVHAQWDADTAAGLAVDHPRRRRFDSGRAADVLHWDVSVLYYPWGDSEWRPYLAAGLGLSEVRAIDRLSRYYDETMFALPVAVGLKWRATDRMVLRVEAGDLMSFSGGGFGTLHHLTYNAGVEVRFGGTRRAYWPWNPGRHYW
jgi:opacity protein-like surface antigen